MGRSESRFYSVLGICKDASSSDIRTAYRKLTLIGWRRIHRPQRKPNAGSRESRKRIQAWGDFLHELMNTRDQNFGGREESLEDLQRSFVELFGDDLAQSNPTATNRRHGHGSNAPKLNV